MAHKNGSALQGQRRNVPMGLPWDRENHQKENGTFLKLQEAWSYHTLATAVLPYSSAGLKPLALEEILRQNDSSHDSNDKWRSTVSSHSGVPSRRIESLC
ncbi:hypothetical protein V1477_017277 [Vespula maculifrons]